MKFFRICCVLLGCLGLQVSSFPLQAASNDDSVSWNGVYSDETFRNPRHPARGESFTVELRVFRGDITGAKVRAWDGSTSRYDMVWVRNEGQYDIWRATVDGTDENFLFYRFEIEDGSDTDYYNRMGMTGGVPSSGDFLINTTPLGSFALGANVDGDGVVFRVWAPNAESVHVAGDFNNWSSTAHSLSNVVGFWQTRVSPAQAGQEYQYVIENDGTLWRTDPRSRHQVNSVGNSIILDPTDYVWGDQEWVTPFFEDMIVYELHVGTFSGEDDGVSGHPASYRDVVDAHLDHLQELGVNVVELMPVTEFAADISWGYNPAFQFSPESAYGSPNDLKYLVDKCHQAGIAVIVDVVYNHMGATDLAGNILDFDGEEIYFYPEGNGFRDTPWGPRPDYGRRQVREYIAESIRAWLEEYHMDGFRVDGTDFIKVNTEGWRVMQEITRMTDSISRKAIVIAEQLPNDPAVTVSIDNGGTGMDSQWNDLFHDGLRSALESMAFGDPNMGAVVNGMNHFDFGGVRAVNYIESHDEVAVHGRVVKVADDSNPHSSFAYGRGKLCYGMVMFTAGIPMLLQGQEWAEDRRFGDTTNERIQWSYKDTYDDYYLACRDMTWLRRRSPALRANGNQNIFHVNDGANVVAWHRWTSNGDVMVIVANFSNDHFDSYCIGMPRDGEWLELINTDADIYGGSGRGNGGAVQTNGGGRDGLPAFTCLNLPARSLLVFGRDQVSLVPVDGDEDGLPDFWEERHGLNPRDPSDANEDEDGDGATNLDEFEGCTDPRSASSVFRIKTITRNGNVYTLTWDGIAGKRYEIQAADQLDPNRWRAITTMTGSGEEMSFSNTSAIVQKFYRVVIVE